MPRIQMPLHVARLHEWVYQVRPQRNSSNQHDLTVVLAVEEDYAKSATSSLWSKARKVFAGTCSDVLSLASSHYRIAEGKPFEGRVAVAWFSQDRSDVFKSAIEINERFMRKMHHPGVVLRVAIGVHEEDALRTFDLATPHQVAYSREVLPSTDIHTVPSDAELDEMIHHAASIARNAKHKYRIPSNRRKEIAVGEFAATNI